MLFPVIVDMVDREEGLAMFAATGADAPVLCEHFRAKDFAAVPKLLTTSLAIGVVVVALVRPVAIVAGLVP
jgi:hypothetical protein